MSNPHTLIVYYREGCHLCEQMIAFMYMQQNKDQQVKFNIKLVDIDDDPELCEKYNVDVPVVMYQEEVVFYHFFDDEEFERILKAMRDS
ncbi:MAG TPA: glutaredoxin family protein [Leucothrix mucor]|nr:glutaredoxin family protein [Leucothrix mucor]